jgi:hypothetical protein
VAGAYGLRLDANFVRNLAYDKDAMFRRARGGIINNYAANTPLVPTQADFQSGGNAYMLQATLGKPSPAARGDWNILAGYKRIEPDAMPDGYNDSSFHLGGTNARGYYIGGSYAIDKNTWFTGRWMSTKEVYGAPTKSTCCSLNSMHDSEGPAMKPFYISSGTARSWLLLSP